MHTKEKFRFTAFGWHVPRRDLVNDRDLRLLRGNQNGCEGFSFGIQYAETKAWAADSFTSTLQRSVLCRSQHLHAPQ